MLDKIEFTCEKCDRIREAKQATLISGIYGLAMDVVCVACGTPQRVG